jgi:hypothetical protein
MDPASGPEPGPVEAGTEAVSRQTQTPTAPEPKTWKDWPEAIAARDARCTAVKGSMAALTAAETAASAETGLWQALEKLQTRTTKAAKSEPASTARSASDHKAK